MTLVLVLGTVLIWKKFSIVFKTAYLILKDERMCFSPAPCAGIGFLLCLDHM